VPCAFPLDEQFTAGVLTSGFLTPTTERAFAHPATLRQRILDRHPGFDFKLSHTGSGRSGFIARGIELVGMKFDVIRLLRDEEPWDVLFAVIDEPDPIQHGLWAAIVDVSGGGRLLPLLDREIGRLVEDVSGRGTLLIVSDHGFRRVRPVLRERALERIGYLESCGHDGRRWSGRWPSTPPGAARQSGHRALPAPAAGQPDQDSQALKLPSTFRSMRAVGVSRACSGIYFENHDPTLVEQATGISSAYRSFPT
jgi:hypothetical protein